MTGTSVEGDPNAQDDPISPDEEFEAEASLREVYLFPLNTQGNIYTSTTLHLGDSHKLLVGTLNRKMYCLEFDRHHLEHNGDGPNPEVKDLQFTYIPSGAEIISIDAFRRSGHCQDFVIGITIIKLQPNDSGIAETGSTGGGQYLNIYSDWEQPQGSGRVSTGYYLENLSQSCLSIELDFIPYQLTHCEVLLRQSFGPSNIETVWVLLGSDLRAHIYIEDGSSHSYVDAKDEQILKAIFPELDRTFPSVPLWIDFFHLHDTRRRVTAVGCEDGELFMWIVDLNYTPAKIILSDESEFESSVSQVKFYKEFDDHLSLGPEFEHDHRFKLKKSNINLLAVSSVSPSVVFENVLENGLQSFRKLIRSDDYDVTTCGAVVDIDFDGEKEIVLGTFGQEILVFKLVEKWEEVKKILPKIEIDLENENEIERCETFDQRYGFERENDGQVINLDTRFDIEKDRQSDEPEIAKFSIETGEAQTDPPEKHLVTKWDLMWTRAFDAPILSLKSLDLTGDGVEEIAVTTTRGVEVLQHDMDKIESIIKSRAKTYLNSNTTQ